MSRGDPLTVARDGVTLSAWLHGVEGAPLVVFIHGGFMDRHMFEL